jgi:HD-GYP domain-containing protein (c-di-GMP phosphodiesterase class II)
MDLMVAYDSTLEGWASALELRDEETEGHARRVTEMTERLALAVGVQGQELNNIRRGALLHDIGKMGIPDQILLKPGPLNDEEWKVMRTHPELAYKLIAPISFLRPAIDIPYCHHEKWDGSGYPRRLKGEDIPLSARLFAIIDVWDALSSDRPYRKAWDEKRVYEHLLSQSGSHFDPAILKVFLNQVMGK